MLRAAPDAGEVVAGLWVGSAPGDRQAAALARRGIDAVVDLREGGGGARWPEGVEVVNVPLVDHGTPTPAQVESATAAVLERWSAGRTVLVHCMAGIERAPTVTCAALLAAGWPLSDAWAAIRAARPGAAPTAGQMRLLEDLAALRTT